MKRVYILLLILIIMFSGCADENIVPANENDVMESFSSDNTVEPTQTELSSPIATTPPDVTETAALNTTPTTQPTALTAVNEQPTATAKQPPSAKPTPTSTIKPVEWEIKPTPSPTEAPTPALNKGNKASFTEIDIDSSDSYRDFAAEFEYADNYGETEFYRLTEKGYVKLGTISGYVTGSVGYQKPTITVDGSGVIYSIEQSVLASWSKIAKTYVIKNNRMSLNTPADSIYKFRSVPIFTVSKDVTVYDFEQNCDVKLVPGDHVTFEGSDEKSKLIGAYSTADTSGYVLLYMEDIDCIKSGAFFGDCFYSDEVEWVG